MSWLAKLYETYEAGVALDLPEEQKLMPISHTLQNAHIKIVIDGNGNFLRANALEKTQVVLPATEKSAGRSSGEAPHPLADKLQYVAKDYPDFGGKKKSYFPSYEKQLRQWCDSPFAHKKAIAVYNYIKKGRVVADLVQAHVLYIDENKKFLASWPLTVDSESPLPTIYKVLPPLPKNKRAEKDKAEVEQGDALVCWQVEQPGELQAETWLDPTLQKSWIQFQSAEGGESGLCFVTGKEQVLATNHPAKLRHTGDKAKILSANDSSGFTFRGRFTEGNGRQAAGVGYEVTQKAHNALRWLIDRQGFRNGDQVYVTWAVTGKAIPDPLKSTFALLEQPLVFQEEPEKQEFEETLDYSTDIGASFAHKFNKYLRGYRAKLEPNEQIIVMGLDSATPGRMSVIYYRQLLASEFFERLEDWHLQFSWPQRYTIEVESKAKNRKLQKKTIWPVSSPIPKVIAETAYGNVLKSHETLKKSLLERIMPSIVDGQPFPRDIMESAVRRASNRNNCESWEWERNLGVACALYRGFYQRQPEHKRRNYSMSLDENKSTRDYLYGRLLAIAERIEEVALAVSGESRPTTAARLMQRFADRPFSTWRNLELALQPYMQRLQGNRAGFLTNRKKDLDTVMCLFKEGEFQLDKGLSGEFLLGYHCQKMSYRQQQTETTGIDKGE
nr:type I-C CRISPR-associated protein Cas8c/Csd1 [uncultured Desulfuromonas sp.]